MKFVALLGAFLLHDALACADCDKHASAVYRAKDEYQEKADYRFNDDKRKKDNFAFRFADKDFKLKRDDDRRQRDDGIFAHRDFDFNIKKDKQDNHHDQEGITTTLTVQEAPRLYQADRRQQENFKFESNFENRGYARKDDADIRFDRKDDRRAYRADRASFKTDDISFRAEDRAYRGDRDQVNRRDNRHVRVIRTQDRASANRDYHPFDEHRQQDHHDDLFDDHRRDIFQHHEERHEDRPIARISAFDNCVGEACKAHETLEAPKHDVQNFDIAEKHLEVRDFDIANPNRKPQKLDDDRKREVEARARETAAKLADFKEDAIKIKADKLEDARKLADDSDLAHIKMKRVELPVVSTTVHEATYYKATLPTLAVPSLPEKHELTKPYVFDEKVCETLDCKLAKPHKEERYDEHDHHHYDQHDNKH